MMTQRFIGSPQVFRTPGIGAPPDMTEVQKLQIELQKLQMDQAEAMTRASVQGPAAMAEAANNTMAAIAQKTAELKAAEDAAAQKLWWSQNWPYIAGGAALLGLAGVLVWKKA